MYIDDINIQSTTGIGENETLNSISVFPTITSGDVYVNMNNIKSDSNVISIYDAQGKLVETLFLLLMQIHRFILILPNSKVAFI